MLTPAVIRNAPHQSIFTSRRTVGRCSVRCSRTIAASTNGTPTRKQARQPSGESTRKPPSSGPPTVAEAKTAPKIPEYRPSSRGGMIAAITICTRAVRPPAPRPCRTRLPSSTSMFGAKPATSEPTTKKLERQLDQQLVVVEVGELAPQRHGGRHRQQFQGDDPGVDDWLAPRSWMIRGSAVDTTVPARIATNMPIIRPEIACMVCRGVSWAIGSAAASVATASPAPGEVREVVVMPDLSVADLSGIPVQVEAGVDALGK